MVFPWQDFQRSVGVGIKLLAEATHSQSRAFLFLVPVGLSN